MQEGEEMQEDDEDFDEVGGQKPEDQVVETDPTRRYKRSNVLLGRGAFKSVYNAFDELEGMEVAWNKVPVTDAIMRTHEKKKLLEEIHILSKLKHKNIITLYNYWIDEQELSVNFITELFTSGNLKRYRMKHKKVDTLVLKNWAWQILQGLVYLHGHKNPIIHRDLKCDNIFVNGSSGQIKIGDMGLATIFKGITHPRSCIGTPEFMAPELYDGEYDQRVDVYSYGMCLLELASMEYPYQECTNTAQIYKKVMMREPPMGIFKVQDPQLRQLIEVCIAEKQERPESRQLLKHPFFDEVRDQFCHRHAVPLLADDHSVQFCAFSSPTRSLVSAASSGNLKRQEKSPERSSQEQHSSFSSNHSTAFHQQQHQKQCEEVIMSSSFEMNPGHPENSDGDPSKLEIELNCRGDDQRNNVLMFQLIFKDPVTHSKKKTVHFPFIVERDTLETIAHEMMEAFDFPPDVAQEIVSRMELELQDTKQPLCHDCTRAQQEPCNIHNEHKSDVEEHSPTIKTEPRDIPNILKNQTALSRMPAGKCEESRKPVLYTSVSADNSVVIGNILGAQEEDVATAAAATYGTGMKVTLNQLLRLKSQEFKYPNKKLNTGQGIGLVATGKVKIERPGQHSLDSLSFVDQRDPVLQDRSREQGSSGQVSWSILNHQEGVWHMEEDLTNLSKQLQHDWDSCSTFEDYERIKPKTSPTKSKADNVIQSEGQVRGAQQPVCFPRSAAAAVMRPNSNDIDMMTSQPAHTHNSQESQLHAVGPCYGADMQHGQPLQRQSGGTKSQHNQQAPCPLDIHHHVPTDTNFGCPEDMTDTEELSIGCQTTKSLLRSNHEVPRYQSEHVQEMSMPVSESVNFAPVIKPSMYHNCFQKPTQDPGHPLHECLSRNSAVVGSTREIWTPVVQHCSEPGCAKDQKKDARRTMAEERRLQMQSELLDGLTNVCWMKKQNSSKSIA